MSENDIKEALSCSYLAMIANRAGIKCTPIPKDNGVDCQLEKVINRGTADKPRLFDSGNPLTIQMKATTERQVIRRGQVLHYRLENKTYNDLVYRREKGLVKLILCLFVLPENPDEWLVCAEDSLEIRKHIYWWSIPDDATSLKNENSRKTIYIPQENQLNLHTISEVVDRFTVPKFLQP